MASNKAISPCCSISAESSSGPNPCPGSGSKYGKFQAITSTLSEGIHWSISPGPPSNTDISQLNSFAFPLVEATARGLTSHALTFQPRSTLEIEIAPLPHPISSNLRPPPEPSPASTWSSNIESSLGGYTVGATVSEMSSRPQGLQVMARPRPLEYSTSRSIDNSPALPRL